MLGDIIAAISTPPGKGGVAVIRMSGEGAVEIADKAFLPISGKPLSAHSPRMQVYGHIIYNEEIIDDGLATRFDKGASFTGEETVEISCHGGILVTRTVLESLIRLGARPAEAGEFTRRAHLSGRLSLTEAEAIGTLLEAKSLEQIRLSSSTARTRLAREIEEIRNILVDTASSICARIDYPEEDLGDFTAEQTKERLCLAEAKITRLLNTYPTGKAINEGIDTVICGKPNVGKSTLYNCLLGEDAAIVTSIPGTTRDVLSATAPLGKVLLNLRDTAGVRADAADEVEAIGIDRSRDSVMRAELILCLFDTTRPLDGEDRELIRLVSNAPGERIALLGKSRAERNTEFDRTEIDGAFTRVVEISTEEDAEGTLLALSEIVEGLFCDGRISVGEDAILSGARQHAAILRGLDFLRAAIEAVELGIPEDAVASEIDRAIGAISEVDGRAVRESIVADIFSKFCVGK